MVQLSYCIVSLVSSITTARPIDNERDTFLAAIAFRTLSARAAKKKG
ncbi:MAG: hypothetical protein IK087_05890 [Lachnospiraceae bacterium]|nr:hypothetical protein [Lachnospiraceae bacterium]